MALNFSKASTQFVRNLVELGVCENTDCLNAYHPPAGAQNRSVGTAQRLQSLSAAAAAPSTRPVIPIDVPRWVHALDSDDFPMTEVCHQLSSSDFQVRQPLERFIDELFTNVSRRYSVQLETLVRALRLLERVQMTNIRLHQQVLLSQSSLLSSHSSNVGSFGSGGNSLSGAGVGSTTATLQLRNEGTTQGNTLVLSAGLPSASAGIASSAIPCSPSCRPRSGNVGGFCGTHLHSFAHGSLFDGSSVSSGTVGPLTDMEQLSYGRCSGGDATQAFVLASWCLPTTPPCESPVPNAVDLPFLMSRLHLCAACAGSRVFTLQYYNVHLLLAACLALSISINEIGVMEGMTEDALMHHVAEMSHCTDLPLQVAARVVCETLEGELCVFNSEVDALIHRLNVVETCVFATDSA